MDRKFQGSRSPLLFALLVFLGAWAAPRAALGSATLSPSGGDDTAIVQAALSAGGTIALAGTLRISKPLAPAAGTRITGGQLLWTGQANTANTYAISFNGVGLTVTGVTFNGAGVTFSGAGNVSFIGNTVENIPGGTPNGINFTGLTNSAIDGNALANIAAIGAIFGYNPAHTTFNGNTISNVGEGMHILWNAPVGDDAVSGNDVSGFARHGIELQGDPQGLQVNDNFVHDPAVAASHIWLSIATGGETTRNDNATGVIIHGNACSAPAGFAANPPINYCMLEAMGIGTQVTGNYFAGGGWGGLVTDNPNMTWSNNQCHGVAAGVPYTQEPPNPAIGAFNAVVQAGNTSDAVWTGTLPPAIAAAVGPAATSAGGVSQPAATQPAIAVSLVNNADGSLSASWNDVSSGKLAATISIAPTSGAAGMTVQLPPPAIGATSARIGNIPANWVVTVSVAYAASSGNATLQVTGGPAPASNATWSPALMTSPAAPTTQSAPTPAKQPKIVTHTITVYSDGSVVTN